VRGPTFTGVRCGLDALQAAVGEPRADPPPAVVARLLRKARTLIERAAVLVGDGRLPQGGRRLQKAGITLERCGRRLRRLGQRGALDRVVAAIWTAEAEALAGAVAGLRGAL